ncbi:MAG: hypothetical protein H6824_24730 [Planctomycetaceae bacterium]|nr:hypothetical protein [Planctomycetaceae bacterium]
MLYAPTLSAQQPQLVTDQTAGEAVIPIANSTQADEPLEVERVEKGTSSRWTRNKAVDELPLAQLSSDEQLAAAEVLDEISLYRRLPTIKLQADSRVYSYFTENPDVAISIWRAMQISQVKMNRLDQESFTIDTGDGTIGNVRVLHQSDKSHLILCDGDFQSPALKRPLKAKALMHLQPQFNVTPDGQSEIVHTLDLFVSFPSQTVETVARLISPVSNHVADRNFEEVSLFIEMMDVAMSKQPGWVEQTAYRLDCVDPKTPDELLKVTAEVYVESQKRGLRHPVMPEADAESATRPFLQRIFR